MTTSVAVMTTRDVKQKLGMGASTKCSDSIELWDLPGGEPTTSALFNPSIPKLFVERAQCLCMLVDVSSDAELGKAKRMLSLYQSTHDVAKQQVALVGYVGSSEGRCLDCWGDFAIDNKLPIVTVEELSLRSLKEVIAANIDTTPKSVAELSEMDRFRMGLS